VAFADAFRQHRLDHTPGGLAITFSEVYALAEMLYQRGINSSDLGKRLHLHKSTVSRLVAQLVERGWVERQPCMRNGRVLALHLKPEGVRVAVQVALARGGKSEVIINALRKEELPAVLQSLANLVRENSLDKTRDE